MPFVLEKIFVEVLKVFQFSKNIGLKKNGNATVLMLSQR